MLFRFLGFVLIHIFAWVRFVLVIMFVSLICCFFHCSSRVRLCCIFALILSSWFDCCQLPLNMHLWVFQGQKTFTICGSGFYIDSQF